MTEKAPATRTGEPTPLAPVAHTVTSASVGTVLATGAGTITAFTLTQPTSTQVDDTTPLTLVDAAAAPTGPTPPPRTIFSANMRALACLNEPRPGVGLTPGMTAPTWPKNVVGPAASAIPFSSGCFVQSCPANVTFTVTC
jgi:hypothetical protein